MFFLTDPSWLKSLCGSEKHTSHYTLRHMMPAINLAPLPPHTHTHTHTLRQKICVFPATPCSFGGTSRFLCAHSLDKYQTCQQWEVDMLHNSSPDFWRLQIAEMNTCVVSMCMCLVTVMPNSLQPYGLQSAKRLCPWNSPCKNTGVGCHALL